MESKTSKCNPGYTTITMNGQNSCFAEVRTKVGRTSFQTWRIDVAEDHEDVKTEWDGLPRKAAERCQIFFARQERPTHENCDCRPCQELYDSDETVEEGLAFERVRQCFQWCERRLHHRRRSYTFINHKRLPPRAVFRCRVSRLNTKL